MLVFTLPGILYAVHKGRLGLMVLAACVGLVFGLPWDVISGVVLRTWYWNEEQLLGVWVCGLPIEEILFMALVPMALISFIVEVADIVGVKTV